MIIQAGPYPPPYGGVSIYIERMKEYMDAAGIKNQVWDTAAKHRVDKQHPEGVLHISLKAIPYKYFTTKNISLINYNISGKHSKYYIGFFNMLLFNRRIKVLTLHGDSRDLFTGAHLPVVKCLSSFNAIICVKPQDMEFLKSKGVNTRLYEIPAFIPPNVTSGNLEGLPEYVNSFINSHPFIISANASSLVFHHSIDLYGADMFVELASRLNTNHPDRRIGFIFCLPDIGSGQYYTELKRRIAFAGLEKDFLFINERVQLHKIIAASKLFIRPTCTDGYSVSLAEAVYLKIPAIASDAVVRPENVIQFRTRDFEDLYKKTSGIITNYEYFKNKAENAALGNNAALINNAAKILKVYSDLGCL